MRASSSLRLALFASFALAASAAKCAYSCDASASPESVCHASCRPVFALCGPGQTCTSEFHLGDGVDAVTASFAYGTAAGSGAAASSAATPRATPRDVRASP